MYFATFYFCPIYQQITVVFQGLFFPNIRHVEVSVQSIDVSLSVLTDNGVYLLAVHLQFSVQN